MAITLSSSTVTYNDGSTTTTNTPNATAALAVDAIGTYAWCNYTGNVTDRAPGFTIAGSSLRFTGGTSETGTVVPSGSWRLMGALPNYPVSTPKGYVVASTKTSVWLRYA